MYYVGRMGDMLFVTASGSGDVHVLIHCAGSSHSMTTVLHAGLPGGGILISCSAVGNLHGVICAECPLHNCSSRTRRYVLYTGIVHLCT